MSARGFVLGIDFGGTKMALATADAGGAILQQEVLATLAEQGAEQAIARAIDTGRQLVDRTRAKGGGELIGVGVATMGITLEDRVYMAPNVPGWERLAIPRLLRQAFAIEAVRVENDVKAAAYAELRWGALAGADTGIFLNLGTGIAAALIMHGHVLRGAHGAAGEIAYNLRQLHEEVGARQNHAPLEEFAGGGAIGGRASFRFGTPLTTEDLFQRARSDVLARAFVEEILTEVAFHVTNLVIALDPERIVVGGGMMRSKDLILPRLAAHLERFVPFPPVLREAHFSRDAGLMGSVAVALLATI
jgi:glucokinase